MNYKHLILIVLMIFSKISFGSLALNVGVIHKRGIDKSLTLVSEHYSREELSAGQKVEFILNLGIRLRLQVNFNEQIKHYGPSEKVVVEANLHLPSGETLTKYSTTPLVIKLGETERFSYERGKDQLIEISVTPEII